MLARRALAVVLTTPVLLASIGVTGAAASVPKWSVVTRPGTRPEPTHGRTHGDLTRGLTRGHTRAEAAHPDDDDEDEGLLTSLTGELAGRF
ncbi:hypothetical protein GCM10010260_23700 [Streptomyces filipinensis]|uniref:Uncharacterized protein n=1 Tax=Streptomyces filipinensis TaxID=66887 RepID=A0A918IAR3_9ACTN|nr:hypothetical protein [Streptomyces filipinensis]GGU89047.1 hypothetical protein GCM10010260_23700 [Streptomyces filipinensis]